MINTNINFKIVGYNGKIFNYLDKVPNLELFIIDPSKATYTYLTPN